ncbi:MAG: hypothetical protein ACYTGH_03100 [Planctomycetota bacterium]
MFHSVPTLRNRVIHLSTAVAVLVLTMAPLISLHTSSLCPCSPCEKDACFDEGQDQQEAESHALFAREGFWQIETTPICEEPSCEHQCGCFETPSAPLLVPVLRSQPLITAALPSDVMIIATPSTAVTFKKTAILGNRLPPGLSLLTTVILQT